MNIIIRGFNGAVFRGEGIINLKNDPNLIIFKNLIDKLDENHIKVSFFENKSAITKNSKIFFFDFPYSFRISEILQLLRELMSGQNEKVLILFEPPIVAPLNYFKLLHIFFGKIYTWNDDIVDNKKYFKYYWPQSTIGYNSKAIPFKNKKFITLINGNKLPLPFITFLSNSVKEEYSERIRAIEFFENNNNNNNRFDLYGRGWNQKRFLNFHDNIFGPKQYKSFRGSIENKLEILSTYKYCICYENQSNINGYITEKIFDCFKARTVPIYLGAANIEKYIPANCFIDFRKFDRYEDLSKYLESITEVEYHHYIENIEKLLGDQSFFNR